MQHEIFMQRALELAQLGAGHVSPNPLVGCVIALDRKIVGEGWHKKHGEAHAEINAINAVADKNSLREATVYVNLEPCSHHGKTPPCADRLIELGVKKVVIANLDTNPLVAGNGIKKLRESGAEVITGVLQKQGRELNKRFFTYVESKRPYIALKLAQTADGFIAHENYESKWISNEYSRQCVHRWRSEEDAVLVGTRTAQHDNPQLSVRDWSGRNPVRIVLDRFLRLSSTLHLFDRSQPTLCYNLLKHEEHPNLTLIRLEEESFFDDVINDCHHRKIQSILVEGGAETLRMFIDRGLWDETRIFTSHRSFEKGIAAPVVRGHLVSEHDVMGDRLSIYVRQLIKN